VAEGAARTSMQECIYGKSIERTAHSAQKVDYDEANETTRYHIHFLALPATPDRRRTPMLHAHGLQPTATATTRTHLSHIRPHSISSLSSSDFPSNRGLLPSYSTNSRAWQTTTPSRRSRHWPTGLPLALTYRLTTPLAYGPPCSLWPSPALILPSYSHPDQAPVSARPTP
jgi:hypothetical protein